MKKIELVEQLEHNGCMSACLAMLAREPLEKVAKRFHDDMVAGITTLADAAAHYGILLEQPQNALQMLHGKVYVLYVSGGIPGALHAVLADTRGATVETFDPARHLKVSLEDKPNTVKLRAFVAVYEVVLNPHLEIELDG